MRKRDHPRGHGGGAPARRPARGAAGIPRVARDAVRVRLGDRQDPELGRIGLADDDRAGAPQLAHRDAVHVRHVVVHGGRSPRHRHARDGGQQVLHGDRHAGERPLVTAPNAVSLRERALGGDVDERVQLAVHPLDRGERRLDQLARAALAVADHARLLERGLPEDVVGHGRGSVQPAIIAAMPQDDRVPDRVVRVRAPNPSPLTLDGTNTYVVEHWVVDPGPADDGHLDSVVAAAGGAVEGIVLTHDHGDHSEGAPPLAERTGAEVVRPGDGERVGPFEAIATPGHAPEHVALLAGRLLFTGDTVLGAGSVFIAPGEGSLAAYLESLRRLRRLELDAILPGHGPVVWSPHAKLDVYIEHRLMRERLVLDALSAGARTRDEL